MKILFAHDVPLKKDSLTKKVYSSTFDYKLWLRYLKFSDKLVVASRLNEFPIEDVEKYKISSGKNVEFIGIPTLSNPKTRFRNLRIAKKILEKNLAGIDGVVVRLPSEIGLLTYKIAKKMNIAVAVEMVGCPEESYKFHGSLIGKLYAPLVKKKYKKVLSDSKFTLYVTKEYLQKKYPPNGFNVNASNVVIKENKINSYIEKRIFSNKILLGTIGSLDVDYKGLETAIICLSLLKKKYLEKEIYLEVVGGGNTKKWIEIATEYELENSIIFKGKVNHNEIRCWMEGLDIYIQPSKTEGLPRTVIEAMNEGLPVVASNVGGIPELIDEEYLHEPLDTEAMSNKILNLIVNKELLYQQSQKNFLKAKNYDERKLEKVRNFFFEEFSNFIKKI